MFSSFPIIIFLMLMSAQFGQSAKSEHARKMAKDKIQAEKGEFEENYETLKHLTNLPQCKLLVEALKQNADVEVICQSILNHANDASMELQQYLAKIGLNNYHIVLAEDINARVLAMKTAAAELQRSKDI